MIDIPKQLQKEQFRFCLLNPERPNQDPNKVKAPFNKEWWTQACIHNDPKLLQHIKNGHNYGVATGYGGLVVIDFDNKDIQEDVLNKLPKTFTVKTGSGLLHKYFICNDKSNTWRIKDKDNVTLIDVQGDKVQVVGAGSKHPNGKIYEIVDESQICSINYSFLESILSKYDAKKNMETSKKPYNTTISSSSDTEDIKRQVSVKDILNHYNIDTTKNPTECPLHSSKGGKCLSFKDEVWHCFNCDEGGDIFTLVMKKENCDFKTAIEEIKVVFRIKKPIVNTPELEEYDRLSSTQESGLRDQVLNKIKEAIFILDEDSNPLEIRDIMETMHDNQVLFTILDIEEILELIKSYTGRKITALRKELSKTRRRKYIQAKEEEIEILYDANANKKMIIPHQPAVLHNMAISLMPNSPAEQFAKFVTAFLEERPLYYDNDIGTFWLWDDELKVWDMGSELEILRIFNNVFKICEWINPQIRSQIINTLKVFADKSPKDAPVNWVQFKNGVYDIDTKEFFDATPEYKFTNPLPINLGKSECTPTIDKLFREWVGEEKSWVLKEILAYSLYRDYPIQRMFFLLGRGANGKGCFMRLLQNLIGENNTTATDLEMLTNPSQRFERAKLMNKLVAIVAETNKNLLAYTSIIKSLTGGDQIPAEIKNKNPFTFKNYAKIIIASNALPMTFDDSDGFYRRVNIVDFPNQFNDGIDILATIPEIEYENLNLQLISVLSALRNNGAFSNDGDIEHRRQTYEQHSTPLKDFIKNNYIEDMDSYIIKSDFNHFLDKYLKEMRFRRMNTRDINHQLKFLGYTIKKKKVNNVTTTVIEGLREPSELDEEYDKKDKTITDYIKDRNYKLKVPLVPTVTTFSLTNPYVRLLSRNIGTKGTKGTEIEEKDQNQDTVTENIKSTEFHKQFKDMTDKKNICDIIGKCINDVKGEDGESDFYKVVSTFAEKQEISEDDAEKVIDIALKYTTAFGNVRSGKLKNEYYI